MLTECQLHAAIISDVATETTFEMGSPAGSSVAPPHGLDEGVSVESTELSVLPVMCSCPTGGQDKTKKKKP